VKYQNPKEANIMNVATTGTQSNRMTKHLHPLHHKGELYGCSSDATTREVQKIREVEAEGKQKHNKRETKAKRKG